MNWTQDFPFSHQNLIYIEGWMKHLMSKPAELRSHQWLGLSCGLLFWLGLTKISPAALHGLEEHSLFFFSCSKWVQTYLYRSRRFFQGWTTRVSIKKASEDMNRRMHWMLPLNWNFSTIASCVEYNNSGVWIKNTFLFNLVNFYGNDCLGSLARQ